jgi:hypothetical protein
MAIERPKKEDLKRIANENHFELNDAEADAIGAMLPPIIAFLDRIDQTPIEPDWPPRPASSHERSSRELRPCFNIMATSDPRTLSVTELPDIRAGGDLWVDRANVDAGSHDRDTGGDHTLAHLVTPLARTS